MESVEIAQVCLKKSTFYSIDAVVTPVRNENSDVDNQKEVIEYLGKM